MGEGVLVTDLQAGHPPVLHVGMVAIGDMDAPPAAQAAFVGVIEPLEAMKIMQIPDGGGFFAVDFERVERLVTAGVARGFERGQRAVGEAAEEEAGVIDARRAALCR